MEQKTYKKRSGTTNKGLDYEVLGIANYAIDLVTNEKIRNFQISSNHPDFGAFDDIVIETEQDNCAEIHAIQLKHNDRGTLPLIKLTSKKGDFSIQKYFDSVQSIKVAKANFILYTNLRFDVGKDKTLYLDGEDFPITVTKIYPKEAFKISGKTDYCYKFSVVGDECSYEYCPEVLLFKIFFQNFYLYTNQENSDDLKLQVTEKFKTCFCGSDVDCDQYVRFLREWSLQNGKIEKLNKRWLTLVIGIKLFYFHIKPLSFDNNYNTEGTKITRRHILREAIDTFDVSIFGKESYDEVKTLWVDAKNEFTDLKIINKLRIKYHLNSSNISDLAKIDAFTLSLMLWLMGKAPLIFTQNASVCKAVELCVGQKFVLLGDYCVNSFSESVSVFKTLLDLKAKTAQYEQVIQNFTCCLQGKGDISVGNLVRDNEEILSVLKPDDLLEMLKGHCRIGEAKESLSEPYVDRCLSKNAIDVKLLDNLSKETVIILDCVSQKPNLRETLTNHKLIPVSNFLNIDHSVAKIFNSSTIYISEKRCEYSEFETICNKSKNSKHFHQFRIKDDGGLEWIRSRGDISDIEKYQSSVSYYIKESDLDCSEFKNTINLLASDPGMGKSELMKSFKIKSFFEFFTVIVDPNDTYAFLKNNSDVTNHTDAFLKFLIDEKYKMLSVRDKTIFRIFLKQNKIIIVWDAVDELSDEHRDVVSNIIVELSESFHQWVTSRRHLLNILQQKFCVLSVNLDKFNEAEQTNYIHHRLADLSKTDTIETILKKISSSFALVEHKDILGIPLQISLLTELFRQDKEKYLALLNNFFTLTDLYHYFIDEKFNILFREKLQIDLNTASAERLVQIQKKQILELCIQAALRLLFPDEIFSKIAVHGTDNFKEICENHQNIGLITEIRDNIPRFIHNSFAEYLAALYLSNQSHRKDILAQVMFDPKYINVRFFFDLFLARDSKAHVAVLYKNFSFIKSCNSEILTSTDLGGRSLLHLACSWGRRYPELAIKRNDDSYVIDDEGKFYAPLESDEYFETIDFLLEKCDIYKPDEIYNMAATEYARKSTCLLAEMRIVMKQQSIEKLVEIDHMINILYYSAYCGYYDEFEFYFKIFETDLATEEESRTNCKILRHTLDNVRNNIGTTLVYIAAEAGHLKILQTLVTAGADVNLFNKNGRTPLYIASGKGHETIVEVLLEVSADINLPDEDGWTPLHIASQEGHGTIVEILLKGGAGINLVCNNGYTPLYIASQKGHETIVEMLLKAGADINLPEEYGWTPLHIACQEGHELTVEILLKAGVDMNRFNKNGSTPLYIASGKGHETIVEMLLKAGAGVNLPRKNGGTPLYMASEEGHETIVEILLKAGAAINHPREDGCTSLHIASQNEHKTIVEILLKGGAGINLVCNNGYTPLYIASQKGHETIVEMLLKAGADINLPEEYGWTPLHIACQEGHELTVEILLKAGVDMNRFNKNGSTPLYIASGKGHETIVEMLLKAGAGVNLPRKNGGTPLYMASEEGHETIVEILLKAGAAINHPREDGCTSLHIASQNEHKTIVEILLTTGADINLRNREGWTPLHLASQKGHETIVAILLKAGADINVPDKKNGCTPLYTVSAKGDETIAQILLEAGADPNLSNKYGWTPLHIASQEGHETVSKILLKEGANINLFTLIGSTPLYIASGKGHETIVEILLKVGANINLSDEEGWTPLHIASQEGYETIVGILLKGDADIHVPDKYGWTPLHVASQNGYEAIVEMLLKAGADIHLADKDGGTPLHIVSQTGYEKIVEILLKAGAGINFPKKDGWTSLHVASQYKHERIVEILIKAGGDTNLSNKDGCTPFYLASQEGHETIVKLLLKADPDINLPNKNDATPLYIASQNGHEKTVEILLEAGAGVNLPRKDGSTALHTASQEGHETIVEMLLKAGADVNLPAEEGWTPLRIAYQEGHETIVEILLKAGADINIV